MIDLTYRAKTNAKREEEPPLGVVIICLMPFAALFTWMILSGLCA